MSGRRMITCLVGAKIPYGSTCKRVRDVRSISSCVRYFDDKSDVVGNNRTLLTAIDATTSTFCTAKRYKSRTKKQSQDDGSDDDDDDVDVGEITGNPDAKVHTMQVTAMRVDAIVKSTMGMARNKAEVAIYESKIRINGEKALKKSVPVKIGDAVDFVRGPSPKNPDFLIVTRVTILTAVTNNDGYRIKYVKDKSLVIENYGDSWEPVEKT